MKKSTFWLVVILLAAVPAAVAEGLSVPAPQCVPEFVIEPDGTHIAAPGFATAISPGDPALPFKDIYVILPPKADPLSIRVTLRGDVRQVVSCHPEIAPAPPIVTMAGGNKIEDWGRGKRISGGRNVLVYGADAFYPAANVEVTEVGRLRKWRIATVRYYPFRYNPAAHVLEQTKGGRIVLSLRESGSFTSDYSSAQLADNVFADKVASLASNYAEAEAWYSSARLTASSPSQPSGNGTAYVILTTSAVVSGSSKLQQFVNHKIGRGFSVEVVTQQQWGGGTGDSAANNIRAYLAANYVSKGIKYVLLIGNPNPTTGDVPMKMLWPRYAYDTYREAPSDYYYADLTGNWDLNGNGYYGEKDGDFGVGGVDRLPEVIVGRIPFYGDFTALDSILQKIIDYESGTTNKAWVRNALLSMKPSDDNTPGYHLGEAIKSAAVIPAGMTATRVYENNYGLNPAPEYVPCNYSNVLSAWQQHAGFHFWWTHGSDTLAADVFTTGNCQYLDDAYPSFTFQCSCLNGKPENSSNLGFALLKQGAIATDSASRVSWYYPGETLFTNTDSNAGMTYQYALKLIKDHLPCGDAHFGMMVQVPNTIWMNHCVFNLYGDPSVQYPAAPVISHVPLRNTDVTTSPYLVVADVSSTAPLTQSSPMLRWSTAPIGGFQDVQMSKIAQTTYVAFIPPQPYNTTVYYYIEAADVTGLGSTYPSGAPNSLLSFQVVQDLVPPVITHTPLPDTGDRYGPYHVTATVTDDMPIAVVRLYYNVNGSPWQTAEMAPQGNNVYSADIPGPTNFGDTISYYFTATDASLNANTSRLPSPTGCFSFRIAHKVCVAVFNSSSNPPYFVGGNTNAWSEVSSIIDSDPERRFQVTVLTDLKSGSGSNGLAAQDVLVLPDNAVPADSLEAVANWFQPGKVIVCLDSAVCYAAYTGWMWSGSAGRHGYGEFWDYNSGSNDQNIWRADPITANYSVGQVIGSVVSDAQFYRSALPADAVALSGKDTDPSRCYAAYRDVPGRGRLVLLGPFVMPLSDQYSMIREALLAPPQPRHILVTSPNGGETFTAGERVTITFTTSGTWQPGDSVRLEYCTGLDAVWRQVPGAENVAYEAGSFDWDTSGLPGSHGYKVRASTLDQTVSDESDAPFSIIPTVSIAEAKGLPDGSLVRLAGKVVTCTAPGFIYVEEPNRGAGIRITSAQGLYPSALVNITGVVGAQQGERVLQAETTVVLGTGAEIGPYALAMRALGGAAFGEQGAVMEYRWVKELGAKQLLPALGLNNIGLLVRVCGRVTAAGEDWFYVDDGSGCDDGSGNAGVKVFCPGLTPPLANQLVILNAISSTYFDRGLLLRALVVPDATAIQVISH